MVNRRFFAAALLAGAVLRFIALPLPGTRDVGVWKIWTYSATRLGVTRLYGVGGSPPEHRVLDFHGAETTVDYPPLALYELAVVGQVYRASMHRQFPDTALLTAAIKAALILAEAGLAWLLFVAVRRAGSADAARWAAAAYWLNPASIADASVFAYLDPLFVLPAVGALVAAAWSAPVFAGAWLAVAALTKAQAVVIAPAVALTVWNCGERARAPARLARTAAAWAATTAVIVAPIVFAGAGPNMIAALRSLTRHDMLSANAPNLWWVVGYVMRALYSLELGVWNAFTAQTKILQISRVVSLGYPNPRTVGTVLTLAAFGWALWTARRARDLWMATAVAAFLVHAYATLSAQVHENHLFAVVPLLAMAGAGRSRYRKLLFAVSAVFALNLNLFYGISEYIDGWAIPRGLTIVDTTVVLAVTNCGLLVWHARILRGEARLAPPVVSDFPSQTPGQAVGHLRELVSRP